MFCSSKHPLSSVNFFCFSHLKKKRSHIKNFSDGFERFILGFQFDKYNTIPLKLTKICNPHSLDATAIRWISNYSPAKISNIIRMFWQSSNQNHFRFLDSDHWTVWAPSFQATSSEVRDCISLYDSLLINLRLLTFLYGYTWKCISQDGPKGVASNRSVYRVSDYHISSIKCFCDRGNYYTV